MGYSLRKIETNESVIGGSISIADGQAWIRMLAPMRIWTVQAMSCCE